MTGAIFLLTGKYTKGNEEYRVSQDYILAEQGFSVCLFLIWLTSRPGICR